MDKDLLKKHSEGLIALSGCLSGELSRLISNNREDDAVKAAYEYQEIFGKGNFYIEISHHPGVKETIMVKEGLIRMADKTGIPLVATQDIHYLKKEDAEYHDVLLAVQTGNKIGDEDRLTLKNDDFSMRSPEEMIELFKDYPEAIENTVKISEKCDIEIELGKIKLPKFPLPAGKSAADFLKDLITEKTSFRYKEPNDSIAERINLA